MVPIIRGVQRITYCARCLVSAFSTATRPAPESSREPFDRPGCADTARHYATRSPEEPAL